MAQRNPLPATPATPAASTGRYKLRLKELREAAGISQYTLADTLSISRDAYKQYEWGTRKVPYDVLYSLSKYYDISLEYILGYI
ncbi:hypothetical protein AGMMS49992_32930 [Clostridia bacterium]|nr:hypothetical protein AGMMS49992_32930 [Clostridia bacterium]